jgi:hypothetical protein
LSIQQLCYNAAEADDDSFTKGKAMTDSSKKRIAPRWLVVGCVFLFSMLYLSSHISYGVDLADVGFHLTMQRIAFQEHDLSNYYFLSNWLGGAWLALHGETGSFHWALLGGCLIWSLILSIFALICYEVFHCKTSHLLLAVVGGILSLPLSQLLMLIDYYTVPVLFSSIYLLLLVLFFKHRDWEWVWFLLGILHALMIFSRVITVLYCVLPVLCFIGDWKYKYLGLTRKMFLLGVAGFVVACIPGLLWFTPPGAWSASHPTFDGGFVVELFRTLRNYVHTFKYPFTFFSCVLVLILILNEAKLPVKFQFVLAAGLLLLASAFWIRIFRQPYPEQWRRYFNVTNTVYASLGLFLFCLSAANHHWKIFTAEKRLKIPVVHFNILVFVSVCMAYLLTFASASGFFRSLYFGPLFFSLILLLLLDPSIAKPSSKVLLIGMLLVFPISGVFITYGFSFRDLPRSQLTTVIPEGRLKGMRVSAAQAERLLHAEKNIAPLLDTSKPVFAEMHLEFLFHYLFNTRPWYPGWVKMRWLPRRLEADLPETIVIPSHAFDQKLEPHGECTICPFLYQEILPKHYQLTHKDQLFEIYRKLP